MKKLLFLLAILATVLFSSCDEEIKQVSDPKGFTTVELQESPKDTVAVIIEDTSIYVFNDDNLVKHRVYSYDAGETFLTGFLIALTICLIIVIFATID
jgi:hypothetical protein